MKEQEKLAPENALEEYDDVYVYLIEDGERHWYVAHSPHEALKEHIVMMDAEESHEFTVRHLPPTENIAVHFDSQEDTREFEGESDFAIIPPEPEDAILHYERRWRVFSTAAGWAMRYVERKRVPDQICSSVF